jgi:AcrR family transcriptional regulator
VARDTRDRILDAAIDEFAAVGFSGTTTRAICERAAVNGAALNYHWGTKERLWLAASQWAGNAMLAAVTRRFDPLSPLDQTLRQVIGDAFDALVEDARPIRIIAWASLQADRLDFGTTSERFQPVVQFGKQYFANLAARGGIDHEAALASYWGMLLAVFIDQPGHRVFFGKDINDPAHAARMRASLIASALAILGV